MVYWPANHSAEPHSSVQLYTANNFTNSKCKKQFKMKSCLHCYTVSVLYTKKSPRSVAKEMQNKEIRVAGKAKANKLMNELFMRCVNMIKLNFYIFKAVSPFFHRLLIH